MSGDGKSVTFFDGKMMPIFGLGTWQSTPEEIATAINAALEAGYKHIDTAYSYRNEASIGNALKQWFDSGKIKREDLFITTKLPSCALRPDRVAEYLNRSLTALQLSYVDLYLIHHPCGVIEKEGELFPMDDKGNLLLDKSTDLVAVWKAMEAQVDTGKARSIGVSNFTSSQIKRIVKAARIRPANLQVELHVYFQQRELVAFCKALDITVCAYSPIGSPGSDKIMTRFGGDASTVPEIGPLAHPVVLEIAKKHNKTPAQIILKHIIQRGIIAIPKSTNPQRIRENFQVFDFTLDEDDVLKLDALDKRKKGRLFGNNMFKKVMGSHPEYPYEDEY